MSAERNAQRLRSLLEAPEILVLPGVVDPLAARLAVEAGFGAVFATGAGIANALHGLPDIGLLGLAETTEAVSRIAQSVDVPVLADADDGYGNALNAYRAVRKYITAGVAGIMLEDQVYPKKCGHLSGIDVLPAEEMVEKIAAFREARGDGSTVLVARTDAIGVEGFDAAIERAQLYARAGADAVFVEAPTDAEQLAAIPGLVPVPTVANMVEGGRTPIHSAAQLQEMGYAAVYFANMAMRVAGHAMRRAFSTLRAEGSTSGLMDEMLTWEDRQAIAGLPDWKRLEQRVVETRERQVQPS